MLDKKANENNYHNSKKRLVGKEIVRQLCKLELDSQKYRLMHESIIQRNTLVTNVAHENTLWIHVWLSNLKTHRTQVRRHAKKNIHTFCHQTLKLLFSYKNTFNFETFPRNFKIIFDKLGRLEEIKTEAKDIMPMQIKENPFPHFLSIKREQ